MSATSRSNALEQPAPLDEAEPARLVAQEHVLGHGPLGDDRHLLGDERDAPLQRLARRAERDRLAAERQLPLVGRKDAGHDLAERGLAGPVLADEGVNGAGVDRDRDVVERPGAAERLADLADLEVDVALAHDALLGDGQPGHSASGQELVDVVLRHDAAVGQVREDVDTRPPGRRSGWPG